MDGFFQISTYPNGNNKVPITGVGHYSNNKLWIFGEIPHQGELKYIKGKKLCEESKHAELI